MNASAVPRRLAFSCSGLALAVSAWGQGVQTAQRPPQFTDYAVPVARAPVARAEIWGYVDVAVLALVMAIGAWAVLSRRSRNELRVLSLFTVLYFGFYRLGCVCSVGSIQNIAYAATHPDYVVPTVVAAFFALPLVVALFAGRVFCGAACPLGAMQDLVLWRPVRLPGWLSGPLSTFPYLYLGGAVLFAATGTAFAICEYDPFVSFFRLSGHLWPLLFGAGVLASSMFVGRPYCRFLCPYGVLLRWCSAFARHRVAIAPTRCVSCHLCADACPFGAIDPPSTPASIDRSAERARTLRLLVMLPILMATLAFAGWRAAPTLARWDPRVARADELRDEELRPGLPKTLATEAWARHARSNAEAYAIAKGVEDAFRLGAPILGAWAGAVFWLRALALVRRRRRKEYEVDSAACVHCARCYATCPVHAAWACGGVPLRQPLDSSTEVATAREVVGAGRSK